MPKRIKLEPNPPKHADESATPSRENVTGGKREPFPRRAVPDTSDRPQTLTLRLDSESGAPLWSKLSERTLSHWREILAHGETQKAFKLGVPLEQAPAQIISPEAVGSILDAFGLIEARFFAWRYKLPLETVGPIFVYQPVEKALLIPPTQKLLAKYGPEFLQKYGDEITLGFLLVSITNAKAAHCAKVARDLREAEKEKPKETAEPEANPPEFPLNEPRVTLAQ